MTLPSHCSLVNGDYLSEIIDDLRKQLAAAKQSENLDVAEIVRLQNLIRIVERASHGQGIVMKVHPRP